jgi:serralysin
MHPGPVSHEEDILNAARVEGADAAANFSSTAKMSVGDTFSANLSSDGDIDWVRISLVAEERYAITLEAVTLADPYLQPYNGSHAVVAYNDDSDSNFNSRSSYNSASSYTATTSGTYFIAARAYSDSYSGTFIVAVNEAARLSPRETYTMGEIAYQLTDGYWGGSSQAYNVTAQSGTISYNLTALTSAAQGLARDALQIWAETTGLYFVETAGSALLTFDDSGSGAYSTSTLNYSAGTSYADHRIISSAVNISTAWLANYGTEYDGYSYQTFIHEIGHALGLGHAGDYNGSAYYETDSSYTNDSWQATVMSYFSQTDNTAIFADYAWVVSPMMADILAIQDIYGVASDLRTGNTVYGYNSTAGGMYQTLFEGITSRSFASAVTLTIIDSGGYDTVDLRGETVAQRLDMSGGSISDVFGAIGNLSILEGTEIEAAFGGSGNDTIVGTAGRNRIVSMDGNDSVWGEAGADFINGGGGNDMIYGGGGSDTLLGGGGKDTIYGGFGDDSFEGGNGNDRLVDDTGDDIMFGDNGNDVLNAGAGMDALDGGMGNDRLIGGAEKDLLHGRHGNDTLSGGGAAYGLYGEAGDDVLEGGSARDELWGGAGADTFVFTRLTDSTTAAPDKIYDFTQAEDLIDMLALNATWVGTSAFSGGIDELRLSRAGGGSRLELDHDGDGFADVTVILVNNANITVSDLIL